ncbi:MAG: hypothetical protein JXB25_05690 [Deltaproteobacteria bacterium]|nr:hypothetical protein [Deltaproteobacteria bacterium]
MFIEGLSMDVVILYVLNNWPALFLLLALLLMIFRVGAKSNRLEQEVGMLRARLNELMMMFGEMQRMPLPSRAEAKREPRPEPRPPQPEVKAAPQPEQKEPPRPEPAPPMPKPEPPPVEPSSAPIQQEAAPDFSIEAPPEAAVPVPPAAPAAPKPDADRAVVPCANCGNKLAYKKELAGKKVRCPSCKSVVALP